jgi:CHAT domain-containing protein
MRIRQAGADPASAAIRPLVQQQSVLEQQVRDLLRREADRSTQLSAPPSVAELVDGLADLGLLELLVADSAVFAVTVVAGRARLRRVGPLTEVARLIDQVVFALRRLTRQGSDPAGRDAARALLRHAASRLDQLLIGSAPELSDVPLVIVPTGALQCLPWAALPSCRTRPVTLAPSAALWLAARNRVAPDQHRTVVVAGPTLAGADREARAVAEVHGVVPLLSPRATGAALLTAMSGAALVHIAAHGRLAAHNPMFSDLLLDDGPVFAHDIERLEHAPHTVVLAACDSGRSVVCDGDALLGLSAAFMAAGTSQLVATMLPVLDTDTMSVMLEVHRFLAKGLAVAEALAAARTLADGDEASEVVAASFVSLGAGFVPAGGTSGPAPQQPRSVVVSVA